MYFSKQRIAEVALRLSLGAMYLYSGIDLIRHPGSWLWAIPLWLREIITSVVNLNLYIQIQGGVEIVFALIFLGWFFRKSLVRVAAFLATLEFAAILVLAFFPWSETNFLTTFRDIGLLGAGVALFFLSY